MHGWMHDLLVKGVGGTATTKASFGEQPKGKHEVNLDESEDQMRLEK